ncbi:MAG: KdsC family phosphatase, partial [Bacteriovoracales bacterium]
GIKVGIISGGNSLGVKKRFEENLGLDFIFLGNEDKREAYLEVLKMGYKDSEILFMGDELFDIPLLKRAGFSATVPNASIEVREVVDYITSRPSGKACAREVIDILRYAKGIIPKILDFDEI